MTNSRHLIFTETHISLLLPFFPLPPFVITKSQRPQTHEGTLVYMTQSERAGPHGTHRRLACVWFLGPLKGQLQSQYLVSPLCRLIFLYSSCHSQISLTQVFLPVSTEGLWHQPCSHSVRVLVDRKAQCRRDKMNHMG